MSKAAAQARPAAPANAEPIADELPKGLRVVDDSDVMGMVFDRLGLDTPPVFAAPEGSAAQPPPPSAETPSARQSESEPESPAVPADGDSTPPEEPGGTDSDDETKDQPGEDDNAPGQPVEVNFTPEQEEAIGIRLTEAQEAVRTELTAQIDGLRAQLANASAQPVRPDDIGQIMWADNEADISKHEVEIQKALDWGLANWDGYEGKGDEDPSVAAKDIRIGYKRFERMLQKEIPMARQLLAKRRECDAQAKRTYPELFDPKTEAHAAVESILRVHPYLKATFPQIRLILGAYLRAVKANGHPTNGAGNAGTPRPAPVQHRQPAPPVPPTPAPGAPAAAMRTRRRTGQIDTEKLVAAGGGRDALASAILDSGLLD